jgi:alpha-mannosidase
VLPHRGDWREARLHEAADEFLVPFAHARVAHDTAASRAPTGRSLRVDGAEVSAVLRDAAGAPLTLRLFNPTPADTVASVVVGDDPGRGRVVDLLGNDVDTFTGSIALRPWQIVTIRLG